MDCPKIYEKTVVINSREVDGSGNLRASALLGHLQDVSAEHSAVCGCSRVEMLAQYGVVWMLTRIWVHLDRPVKWLDQLTLRTWHRGGKGVFLYRDYDLYVGGKRVGEAVALWVLPDLQTKKMLNLTQTPVPEIDNSAHGLPPKSKTLRALHPKKNRPLIETRPMRYSETDVNGHINNAKYADFCCDVIPMDRFLGGSFLSELELTYHAECKPGEVLYIHSNTEGDSHLIDGLLSDGAAKFSGKLSFTDTDKMERLC